MIKICINPDGSFSVQGTTKEFENGKVDKKIEKVGKVRRADWNECQHVSKEEFDKLPFEERAFHLCG